MKVEEAVRSWTLQQMGKTLEYYNEWRIDQGMKPDTLNEDSIDHRLTITPPQKCPEGHTYLDDCFEAIPPRQAVVISAFTNNGQMLEQHVDLSNMDLVDLMYSVLSVTNGRMTS